MKRCCSYCGHTGHDRRHCPRPALSDSAVDRARRSIGSTDINQSLISAQASAYWRPGEQVALNVQRWQKWQMKG